MDMECICPDQWLGDCMRGLDKSRMISCIQ